MTCSDIAARLYADFHLIDSDFDSDGLFIAGYRIEVAVQRDRITDVEHDATDVANVGKSCAPPLTVSCRANGFGEHNQLVSSRVAGDHDQTTVLDPRDHRTGEHARRDQCGRETVDGDRAAATEHEVHEWQSINGGGDRSERDGRLGCSPRQQRRLCRTISALAAEEQVFE